jgi:prophage tail gpP-like protein
MRTHDVRVVVTETDSVFTSGLADPFLGGLADPFRATARVPGQPRTIVPIDLDVVNDMLELADEFSFSIPFTRQVWDLCRKDAEVQVWIDDSCVLTGYVEERDKATGRGGSLVEVRGYDKGGRIVSDEAPLVRFEGYGLKDFVEEMVGPWFPSVSLSNARNRRLIKGSGTRGAPVAGEPLLVGKDIQKKVEPGETRGEAILYMLERAELLAWSSADGKEFIIGRPNYDQAPQWRFFMAAPGSERTHEANAIESSYLESNSERYSKITVCGSGRGNSDDYAAAIMSQRGVVLDNPDRADGTGIDFLRPKTMLLPNNDIRSAAEALVEARREQRLRDGRGYSLEVQAPGFGQDYAGASSIGSPFGKPAIFACDTMSDYEDEEAGDTIAREWLVTRVAFTQRKSSGQTSRLTFVPRGTELRAR